MFALLNLSSNITHRIKKLQENIVEKGEIAENEQFHRFPQCFLCNLYLKSYRMLDLHVYDPPCQKTGRYMWWDGPLTCSKFEKEIAKSFGPCQSGLRRLTGAETYRKCIKTPFKDSYLTTLPGWLSGERV